MSVANSLFFLGLLLIFKIHNEINQKIAPRTERKRSSIEFERSENIGQFLKLGLLIILMFLNAFS